MISLIAGTAFVLFLCGVAAIYCFGRLVRYAYEFEYADPRTIICPETQREAEVNVDGPLAARTMMNGREEIAISNCSEWPERQLCDQYCASQVPLVGDDRRKVEFAAFGLTPAQLRIHHPIKMSKELYKRMPAENGSDVLTI